MAQEKKCKKLLLLMVKLIFNVAITAPASFITLPQIWQKNSTLNPLISELWPDERSIYCHSLQAGRCWIKHWAWGCCASVLILTEQILGASPALHSSCCVKGGRLEAPLSPSAVLAAHKTSCKSSCSICFHTGFSLLLQATHFATKLNKPKYLFSFKIP